MKVKVKHVRDGFYGFYGEKRRYVGEEFSLTSESHFSDRWMEKLEEKKKPGRKPKAEAEDGGE